MKHVMVGAWTRTQFTSTVRGRTRRCFAIYERRIVQDSAGRAYLAIRDACHARKALAYRVVFFKRGRT